MSIAQVISYIKSARHQKLTDGAIYSGFTDQTSPRIRDAGLERIPLEQLVSNLRQMITGRHEQLCEARFEEMLDILAEQKDEANRNLLSITDRLNSLNQDAISFDNALDEIETTISDVATKTDGQIRSMKDSLDAALTKIRDEIELKLLIQSDNLFEIINQVEKKSSKSLSELTDAFATHQADEKIKWKSEREHSLLTLEQRIAQWRAEIDDTHRQDMQDVASSVLDIGQRLMALRKT